MHAGIRWGGLAVVAGIVLAAVGLPRSTKAQEAGPLQASPSAIDPRVALMYWHGEAFGKMNLSIAQEKREPAEMNAWLLGELAQLNTQYSTESEYKKLATQLSDEAKKAAEALHEEKYDIGKQLSKEMKSHCKACHDKFRDEKKDDGD